MSVVQVNLEGVDFIDLEFFTAGENQAHLTAHDKLLLDTKDYILGVSELVVPSTSLPIFHPDTDQGLFRVCSRVVGHTAVNALGAPGQLGNNVQPILNITPDRKFYNTSEFINEVASFASTYSQLQDELGVPDGVGGFHIAQATNHRYLYININGAGRLVLKASSGFLNHFFLEVTPLAIDMFGLDDYVDAHGVLGLTRDAATGAFSYDIFSGAGLVVAGNHLDSFNFVGSKSVYAQCDNRIFCSVETHLDVPAGMQVVNSKEQRDNSIGRYFLPNPVQVELKSQNGFFTNDTTFTSKARLGMVAIKRREDPIQKWVTLSSAYERYLFRFQLYITYRKWAATNEFKISKVTMPFLADDYWSLVVTFISRV
jgi:hypothetical protein